MPSAFTLFLTATFGDCESVDLAIIKKLTCGHLISLCSSADDSSPAHCRSEALANTEVSDFTQVSSTVPHGATTRLDVSQLLPSFPSPLCSSWWVLPPVFHMRAAYWCQNIHWGLLSLNPMRVRMTIRVSMTMGSVASFHVPCSCLQLAWYGA